MDNYKFEGGQVRKDAHTNRYQKQRDNHHPYSFCILEKSSSIAKNSQKKQKETFVTRKQRVDCTIRCNHLLRLSYQPRLAKVGASDSLLFCCCCCCCCKCSGQSNILLSIDHILSYLYNVMYNMQLHYDNRYVQRIQNSLTTLVWVV